MIYSSYKLSIIFSRGSGGAFGADPLASMPFGSTTKAISQTVQKVEIHYKMIGYVELPHMSRAAEQSYLAAFGREETGRGA